MKKRTLVALLSGLFVLLLACSNSENEGDQRGVRVKLRYPPSIFTPEGGEVSQKEAMKQGEKVLRQRIVKVEGVSPNIEKHPDDGSFTIEIPGVEDPERVRAYLCPKGAFSCWEIYGNKTIGPDMIRVDSVLKKTSGVSDTLLRLLSLNMARSKDKFGEVTRTFRSVSSIGFTKVDDTARIMELLSHNRVSSLLPDRVHFTWKADPIKKGVLSLYALKEDKDGGAAIEGKYVKKAVQRTVQDDLLSVRILMDDKGSSLWASLTGKLARQSKESGHRRSIAMVLDGKVLSAPTVRSKIENGRMGIVLGSKREEGNMDKAKAMAALLETEPLASSLKFVEGRKVRF